VRSPAPGGPASLCEYCCCCCCAAGNAPAACMCWLVACSINTHRLHAQRAPMHCRHSPGERGNCKCKHPVWPPACRLAHCAPPMDNLINDAASSC
jgi:hypothetical protein